MMINMSYFKLCVVFFCMDMSVIVNLTNQYQSILSLPDSIGSVLPRCHCSTFVSLLEGTIL